MTETVAPTVSDAEYQAARLERLEGEWKKERELQALQARREAAFEAASWQAAVQRREANRAAWIAHFEQQAANALAVARRIADENLAKADRLREGGTV